MPNRPDSTGLPAMKWMRRFAALTMLALMAACGGGGGGPTGPAPTLQSLAITPATSSQLLGKPVQYHATGTYSDGSTRDLTATAMWNTVDAAVVTISASGLASPLHVGTTTLMASSGSVIAYATIHVTVPQATESVLYRFAATPVDGSQPSGPLIQGRDGNFYGVTAAGGSFSCQSQPNFCGTVFKLSPSGVETTLHEFGGTASDGWWPSGALLQTPDGTLYGTTSFGGTHDSGTVYRITPAGDYAVLYSFGGSTADGITPTGGLILGRDGDLYGTTAAGGANACIGQAHFCGTAYKITTAGVETVLYTFGATVSDGWQPAGLVQASDGNFYGTTNVGGTNSCAGYDNLCGTVFKLTPAGVETVLYSFGASLDDASAPQGPLIEGPDGNFYGTTASGGGYLSSSSPSCFSFTGCGTVFRITPAGVETVLYTFAANVDDGSGPTPFLKLARDGNFYGTTYTGGILGVGAVFKLTPDGAESIIYSFGSKPDDANDPTSSLIQGSDGRFYGVSSRAGDYASGAFFVVQP
jgi:uncharacterized repeat protein (TIGR03803 family)